MDKESNAYKSGEFDEMFEAAEIDNLSAEDVVAYSQSKRRLSDLQLAYKYSYSKGEADGRAEGIAKGRAEGIAKGRAEGIAKGKAEGIAEERVRLIRVMRSNGMSAELISMYLGMSLSEIEEIIG